MTETIDNNDQPIEVTVIILGGDNQILPAAKPSPVESTSSTSSNKSTPSRKTWAKRSSICKLAMELECQEPFDHVTTVTLRPMCYIPLGLLVFAVIFFGMKYRFEKWL